MKQKITPRALLEIPLPANPAVSADGKRVVFEVHEPDFEESRVVSRIWMADTSADSASKPRQITFSYEGEHAARWSVDGRHIAFLSTRPDLTAAIPDAEDEEADKEQIWILPMDGGEAFRLTSAREGIHGFRWLPDSSGLIFLTSEARTAPFQFVKDDNTKRKIDPVVENDEKRRRQFWSIALEERKPELIFTGDYGLAEFEISPDGSRIVFNTNYSGEPNDYHQYDLFVMNLETEEEPRKLTERPGPKSNPQWSPNGETIAFLSPIDPELCFSQECLWTLSVDGDEPINQFIGQSLDAEEIQWFQNGTLFIQAEHRTTNVLAHWHPDSGLLPDEDKQPFNIMSFHVGGPTEMPTIAAVIQDHETPPELYVINENGSLRPITEFSKSFLEVHTIPLQEVISWQSDDFTIEGLVTYPLNFDPTIEYPMVVQLHGGPKATSTVGIRDYYMNAVWASEGYVVLQPNFRGGSGYGNEFAIANRRDLGGGDLRDVMAGIDQMIQNGTADPARIGIMGGSYGGYLTNFAIAKSNRFAAAISMFGMFSLITSTANSELSRWEVEYLGEHYWDDPDIYTACSPSQFVKEINTPTLIFHGENDTNTFISNSKEMYHALRTRSVPVQFVHYPREGHGTREPFHKLDEVRRCFAWFDKYLKGGGTAQPKYRVGDKITHEGYELVVTSADEADFGLPEDSETRYFEVTFALESKEPVDTPWELALIECVLTSTNGADCTFAGIPVDSSGGRHLITGSDIKTVVHPDKDTGRLGAALTLCYEIDGDGGEHYFRMGDFPGVVIPVAAKEKKDEAD